MESAPKANKDTREATEVMPHKAKTTKKTTKNKSQQQATDIPPKEIGFQIEGQRPLTAPITAPSTTTNLCRSILAAAGLTEQKAPPSEVYLELTGTAVTLLKQKLMDGKKRWLFEGADGKRVLLDDVKVEDGAKHTLYTLAQLDDALLTALSTVTTGFDVLNDTATEEPQPIIVHLPPPQTKKRYHSNVAAMDEFEEDEEEERGRYDDDGLKPN